MFYVSLVDIHVDENKEKVKKAITFPYMQTMNLKY